MTSRPFSRRLIAIATGVALFAVTQIAIVDPAWTMRRGGVHYGGRGGGHHGGGRHGGRHHGHYGGHHGGYHGGHHGHHHYHPHMHFHGFHVGFWPHPHFWHPIGFFLTALTVTAIVVSVNDRNYHYDQGVYYVKEGDGYKAVNAPIGAKIPDLPDDTQETKVGSKTFYYYMGTFYVEKADGYAVAEAPKGAVVSYLPDGHTTKDIDGKTYYVYGDVYYQAKMVDGGTAYAVVKV